MPLQPDNHPGPLQIDQFDPAAVALQPAVAPSLRALGVPQDVMPMASAYLSIFLWCVPFSMTVNFASAIFRARGDARTPLACLTASGVANVLLNLLFVAGFGMDADGVALATVISNVLAAAALLFILSRTGGAARWRPRDWKPDARALLEMMRIGLPSGVQGAMFAASNIVIQNAINSLGTDVMAGSAAAFNLEILPFYAVNAFGQAATSFIGQNLGANRISRCRHAMKSAFSQALVWGAVFAAAILLAAEPLLALFNRDPAVIAAGRTRLLYINIPVWLDVAIELYSGALRGCGISHKPAIISVFGICGLRVVWMLAAFPLDPTFETLLWSYPLSWAATAVLLGVAWHRHIRRLSLKPAARTAPAERSGT